MSVRLDKFLFKLSEAQNHSIAEDKLILTGKVNDVGLEMWIQVYENCIYRHSICRVPDVENLDTESNLYRISGWYFLSQFSDAFEKITYVADEHRNEIMAELL